MTREGNIQRFVLQVLKEVSMLTLWSCTSGETEQDEKARQAVSIIICNMMHFCLLIS